MLGIQPGRRVGGIGAENLIIRVGGAQGGLLHEGFRRSQIAGVTQALMSHEHHIGRAQHALRLDVIAGFNCAVLQGVALSVPGGDLRDGVQPGIRHLAHVGLQLGIIGMEGCQVEVQAGRIQRVPVAASAVIHRGVVGHKAPAVGRAAEVGLRHVHKVQAIKGVGVDALRHAGSHHGGQLGDGFPVGRFGRRGPQIGLHAELLPLRTAGKHLLLPEELRHREIGKGRLCIQGQQRDLLRGFCPVPHEKGRGQLRPMRHIGDALLFHLIGQRTGGQQGNGKGQHKHEQNAHKYLLQFGIAASRRRLSCNQPAR